MTANCDEILRVRRYIRHKIWYYDGSGRQGSIGRRAPVEVGFAVTDGL